MTFYDLFYSIMYLSVYTFYTGPQCKLVILCTNCAILSK